MKSSFGILALAIAGALAGCSNGTTGPSQSDNTTTKNTVLSTSAMSSLKQAEQQATAEFVAQQPTLATMLALPSELAGEHYNSRFPDYSPAGMNRFQEAMSNAAKAFEQQNFEDLSSDEKMHREILANIFEYYAGDKDFPAGYIDTWGGHLPYIINQISGPLIDIPKLMQVQQAVTTEAEAQDYLARLANMGQLVDNVVAKFDADAQKGIILPANLHPKTLAFFDRFLQSKPAEHELVTSFEKRLDKITVLSDETRNALVEQAEQHLKDVVYPAYRNARQAVANNELRARDADGIWSQPGGAEFYAHAIKKLGDSTYSAEKIHQIGLDEVSRISLQMDKILQANGYTEGSVGERMVNLTDIDGQIYPDTDAGREQLLNYLREETDAIMQKAPQYFGTLPEQSVEVRRIPEVSQAGEAGGFYTPPSLDGTRPGIYWINLRDMQAVPKFGLKTLTYHEAVPGHHFQIALNMAQQDIGLMRQNAPYNAYVEGWALYSEYVASQYMNMYENDWLGDLGRLQAELYRAVRLVVDTGLHHKKWPRQKAIDYFHNTTGTSLSDVIPEIERYMAWPGQALGYKLGMLTFVDLEQQARTALGDKFDIRAFHDAILLPGARPMAMVKKDIKQWIAEQ